MKSGIFIRLHESLRFRKFCTAARFMKTFVFCIVSVLGVTRPGSSQVAPDINPETYNPRFEIMLGGGATNMFSAPEWSSDQYFSGMVGLTMNVLKWFSIQGAKELSYGTKLESEWIDYGPHYQLNTSLRPFMNSSWGGVRFDIPLDGMKLKHYSIHSLLCSFGMFRDEFAIRSTEQRYYRTSEGWKTGESPETINKSSQDTTANMSGYYVSLAARWRLDQILNRDPESFFGQYGIDTGIRYRSVATSSLSYQNLAAVPSGFSGVQVFVHFFTKIDLLF